jgi:hypothetical protein
MNRHLGILLVLTIWALALVSCREKPPAATPTTAGTDVPAGRLNTPAPTGTDTPVGRLNTSSLSGRVTVAGSGQNLPGATVEAWLASSQSNDDVAQPWLAGQANGAISTKTDAGGYYAF